MAASRQVWRLAGGQAARTLLHGARHGHQPVLHVALLGAAACSARGKVQAGRWQAEAHRRPCPASLNSILEPCPLMPWPQICSQAMLYSAAVSSPCDSAGGLSRQRLRPVPGSSRARSKYSWACEIGSGCDGRRQRLGHGARAAKPPAIHARRRSCAAPHLRPVAGVAELEADGDGGLGIVRVHCGRQEKRAGGTVQGRETRATEPASGGSGSVANHPAGLAKVPSHAALEGAFQAERQRKNTPAVVGSSSAAARTATRRRRGAQRWNAGRQAAGRLGACVRAAQQGWAPVSKAWAIVSVGEVRLLRPLCWF